MVMVTSADAHEGKTTVASQLAASLARSGRRTLLVDGDVPTPAAHRVFELPQEPGLCELLRGQVDTGRPCILRGRPIYGSCPRAAAICKACRPCRAKP